MLKGFCFMRKFQNMCKQHLLYLSSKSNSGFGPCYLFEMCLAWFPNQKPCAGNLRQMRPSHFSVKFLKGLKAFIKPIPQ